MKYGKRFSVYVRKCSAYVGKYIINSRSYTVLCMRIKYFMCESESELKNFRA